MRLIDADELIKMLQDTIDFNVKHNTFFKSFSMQHMLYILENMKTIDSVKHGHWILIYEVPSGNYFKCSECNHKVFLKSGRKVSDDYRYCSGCGAKMDGNENGN